MTRSCSYVSENTTKYQRIKFYGIFKREEYTNDI